MPYTAKVAQFTGHWLTDPLVVAIWDERGAQSGSDPRLPADAEALRAGLATALPGAYVERRYHSLALDARLPDPADISARSHVFEVLEAIEVSLGLEPVSLFGLDWATMPAWREAPRLGGGGRDLAEISGAHDRLAAARAPLLARFADGGREVEAAESFWALHVELPVLEAALVRQVVTGTPMTTPKAAYIDTAAFGSCAPTEVLDAIDGLVEEGWLTQAAPGRNPANSFVGRGPRCRRLRAEQLLAGG